MKTCPKTSLKTHVKTSNKDLRRLYHGSQGEANCLGETARGGFLPATVGSAGSCLAKAEDGGGKQSQLTFVMAPIEIHHNDIDP